jgi:hypothetical protein
MTGTVKTTRANCPSSKPPSTSRQPSIAAAANVYACQGFSGRAST